MSVQEKIAQQFPSAQIEELPDRLKISIEGSLLREIAEFLYNDKELNFDFLRNLTGMDWQEKGFGVIYHLESTTHGYQIELRVITSEREHPHFPTLSDIWRSALLNEREVYDYFGIIFTGHPDMRRLFLRDDWDGFPFRKDYEPTDEIQMENESSDVSSVSWSLDENGKLNAHKYNLFEPDEYVMNIGPQHPATHGVMRFRVALDGEYLRKLDIHCGYIHRAIEKISESMLYPQLVSLMDRLDYLSALQNRHAMCLCIEKGIGLTVSDRILYIRTIMDELQRINSHLLFFATMTMDLGALTCFFYGFRDREVVLKILEETTGGRLTMPYYIIGGLQYDIHPDFVKKVKELLAYLPSALREYEKVFTGNIITKNRLKDVGILNREDAINFGTTGPVGRASGWACDVRKRIPYGVYDKVDFNEIIHTKGDSYTRYLVRMEEIVESMKIIEQLIDNIPEGNFREKVKPLIKIPAGSYYSSVETSRGEFGVFIESAGDKMPYRVKLRSNGLPLVGCIEHLTLNTKIADLIAIGGTLDYVVPDIDR